jgi:excisionase family DNA binding protein
MRSARFAVATPTRANALRHGPQCGSSRFGPTACPTLSAPLSSRTRQQLVRDGGNSDCHSASLKLNPSLTEETVMKTWLNVTEAAEYAGVCRDTIYTAVERGELRHVRIASRRSIRLKNQWLDEWLERGVRHPLTGGRGLEQAGA